MPAKKIEAVTDFNSYKTVLKTDLNAALVNPQPFRLYEKFRFNGKTGPLLVVGAWDGTLLNTLKANAGAQKAVGKLALQGRKSLEFQLSAGAAKPAEVKAALIFAGVSDVTAVEVEKFGEEKRDEAEAVVTTAKAGVDEQAAKDIDAKKAALKSRGQAIWKDLNAAERKALQAASGGIEAAVKADKMDAYKSIAEAEQVLAGAEQRLGKAVGPDGTGGPSQAVKNAYGDYAREQEERNKKIDDAMKTPLPTPKKLSDTGKMGDTTVKGVRDQLAEKMGARVAGQAWQAEEIKGVKAATAKLDRQAELGLEVPALDKQKNAARKEVDSSVKAIDKLTKEIADLDPGAEKERKQKQLVATQQELPELRKELAEAEQKLKAAQDELAEVDKWVVDNDAEKVAGKHGSGRHGAQTGVEAQARRVATGGYGADQPGNESGTSRPLEKIQWNKVTLEFEMVEGKKVIKNRDKVLREIVIQKETHFQETIASSLFLGPEFEKEAATRALEIVTNQCKWADMNEGTEWAPIKRVIVTLGKPKRAAGWGTGVTQLDGAKKAQTLSEANKIIEDYRTGKINQAEVLKQLNAQLVTKADGGVAMVPTCLVVLDRTGPGKPWINVTQYPCAGGTPGWNLTGKRVRVNAGTAEEVASNCAGV